MSLQAGHPTCPRTLIYNINNSPHRLLFINLYTNNNPLHWQFKRNIASTTEAKQSKQAVIAQLVPIAFCASVTLSIISLKGDNCSGSVTSQTSMTSCPNSFTSNSI